MAIDQSPLLLSRSPAELEQLFEALKANWHEDTDQLSSVAQKAMHPAYQRIIGLGPVVLPLILHDMEREPDHWFWALRAITGEDPVKREDAGNIQRMTETWLVFGREQGFI